MPPSAPDLLLSLDGAAQATGPGLLDSLIPLVAIVAIFYFLLYRPQAQKEKEKQSMISAIKKDDKVVMSSGLHGKVIEVGESTLRLDVGGKQVLTFEKSSVAMRKTDGEQG